MPNCFCDKQPLVHIIMYFLLATVVTVNAQNALCILYTMCRSMFIVNNVFFNIKRNYLNIYVINEVWKCQLQKCFYTLIRFKLNYLDN